MALHVFNPENDLALACFSPHFIPPASARMMADNLSALPVWWAESGDSVCVSSVDEARSLTGLSAGLCPQVEWKGGNEPLAETEILPWGWSPLLAGQLRKRGVAEGCLPSEACLQHYRDWSNRRHAVRLLEFLHSYDSVLGRNWSSRLCGRSYYCTDEEKLCRILECNPKTILKAPWSGSGKGLRLGFGKYESPLSGWCRRQLKDQGGVVIEPFYDKKADFALEFYADGKGAASYKGLSVFFTTHRGTYDGNWVATESVKERWLERFVPRELFLSLRKELEQYFTRWLGLDYCGCIGVDMMLCQMPGCADVCVHPCVEINLRRTMGMVAVDLAAFLAPGTEGRFVIDYHAKEGALWEKHQCEQQLSPPVVQDGKLVSGSLPLTPVSVSTHYRAVLHAATGPINL